MRILKLFRGQCMGCRLRRLSTAAKANSIDSAANATATPGAGAGADAADVVRPYSELPRHTKYEVIRDFMLGGQFANVSILEYAAAMRRTHGDIFVMSGVFGRPDQVMTFSTKDIEHVFRNEGRWPLREGFESLVYFREKIRPDAYGESKGLVATQGEAWAELRTAMNPILMQPRNMKMYIRPLSRINDEFVARIRDIRDAATGEVPANFEEEVNRLIFESIGLIALNREFGVIRKKRDNPDALKLFRAARNCMRYIFKLDMQPSMWKLVATPTYNKLMRTLEESLEVTKKLVDETKELMAQRQSRGENSQDFSIFEKIISINPKVVNVMAVDLVLAGVDTTANFYIAILLCLAKHPEKQQTLREEIMGIMPSKDTLLDEQRMKDLPYLRAVLKEAMRYYPNGLGTFRSAPHDITLSGYNIPRGTRVLAGTNLLLKDEAHYPRAHEFLPERWLRSPATQKKSDVNPFTFLPLGFGPRSCIGRRIIDLEVETALAKLIRNFHVEFNYDASQPFKMLYIMEPAIPLKFKFTDVQN